MAGVGSGRGGGQLPQFSGRDTPDQRAEKLNRAMGEIVRRLRAIETAVQDGYAVSNHTAAGTRTLDESAATLADVRAVLGTLISDLLDGGTLAP